MSAPADEKTISITDLLVILDRTHLDACPESRRWIEGHPDLTTPAQLWASCERGDYMLWLAIRTTAASRWRPLAYACADRAVRVYAPKALEAACARMKMAGKDTKAAFRDHAAKLRGLARVESSATTREAARAAWAASSAAQATFQAAAWAAAGAAAWAVGAAAQAADWAAAGDAAWAAAGAAAGAAAWAAAWDAAGDAAGAAKAAELRLSAASIRAAIPWSEIEAALLDADAES